MGGLHGIVGSLWVQESWVDWTDSSTSHIMILRPLPLFKTWAPTLALVLKSSCGQARLLGLCPPPSSSWPMMADVPRPWDQNRALGPPAPQGPCPAGTGRASESLEIIQQHSTVCYGCGHGGEVTSRVGGGGKETRG